MAMSFTKFTFRPNLRVLTKRSRRMSTFAEPKSSKREHYETLGVPPNATLTEIREAYFRQVKILHPDVNTTPEAKIKFAIVQEAYKILLSDTGTREKRKSRQG